MKKAYVKPLVSSKSKAKKASQKNQLPMYLADGRWCCKVPTLIC